MSSDIEITGTTPDARAALEAIQGFLTSTAPEAFPGAVGLDTKLLSSGRLDSLGILQLIMFLSEEMQIEVNDDDFVADNLDTVGDLVKFVLRKRGLA